MPGYKTHLGGGLVAFSMVGLLAGVYTTASWPMRGQWLLFSLLGSLFPDIDTKSKGQLWFYRLIAAAYLFLLLNHDWLSAAFLGLLALLPHVVHHRGLFHRAWFIVLLAMGSIMLSCCWMPHLTHLACWDALFFVAGAWSHLWLDLGWKRMFRF